MRTADLIPRPHRIADYSRAVELAADRQRADARIVAAGGESILLVHGRRTHVAVVLFHGLTNSPDQFRAFAELLYREGDNVYVPRLPHHAERGQTAAALAVLTAEELRDAADSAVDLARGLGDSVVVAGLSAGGTMAAWVAQFRPDVARVVIIAPLLALANVPSFLDALVMNLAERLPNVTRSGGVDPRWPDRELGWSTRAVGAILRLGRAVRRAAPHAGPAVRDIRILLNAHDGTVSPRPVLELDRHWRGHGAAVVVHELADSLRLPHDVIDPRQPRARTDVVYPLLASLVHSA